MGSFNTTCMVSGFPITPGTKCRLILLYQTSEARAPGCGSLSLWAPLSLPVPVEYMDYGDFDLLNDDPVCERLFDRVLSQIERTLLPDPSPPSPNDKGFAAALGPKGKLSWWCDHALRSDGRLQVSHPSFPERRSAGHYVAIREDVLALLGAVLPAPFTPEHIRSTLDAAIRLGDDIPKYHERRDWLRAKALENAFGWQHAWIEHAVEPGIWPTGAVWDVSSILPRMEELLVLELALRTLNMVWAPRDTAGQDEFWKAHWDFHEGLARLADGFTPKAEEGEEASYNLPTFET